jgi:two-component system, cell cycle response regulator
MNKYQLMLRKQTENTIRDWRLTEEAVPQKEVYRFLHSLKGTAGTIGLPEWSETAQRLLIGLDEESQAAQPAEEVLRFLQPIISLLEEERDASSESESATAVSVKDSYASALERNASEGLVLLLDDDVGLLRVLKETLEASELTVMATTKPQRALEWFYSMKPDCVVFDIVLPEGNGIELLGSIREQCDKYMVPALLMSGRNDLGTRIECHRSGADEFIAKPLDLAEFTAIVAKHLRRREKYKQLLMLDELTGIFNLNYLLREAERLKEESIGSRVPISIAAIDIDKFHSINDEFGYAEGDRLLQRLAAHLQAHIKLNRLVVRDRADRFYLAVPGASERESREELSQLIGSMSRLKFPTTNQGELYVTCSAGIAEWTDEIPLREALARTVQALHAAKSQGTGQTAIYEPSSAAPERNLIRIGIVDDDPLLCSMLAKRLSDISDEGEIDIRTFHDGEQFFAEDWHRQEGKFLIIADRMMPRMNGMELVARLRSQYGTSRHMIMMLTAAGEEQGILNALKAGVDDYMTKPFNLTELEARVRKLLQRIRK